MSSDGRVGDAWVFEAHAFFFFEIYLFYYFPGVERSRYYRSMLADIEFNWDIMFKYFNDGRLFGFSKRIYWLNFHWNFSPGHITLYTGELLNLVVF